MRFRILLMLDVPQAFRDDALPLDDFDLGGAEEEPLPPFGTSVIGRYPYSGPCGPRSEELSEHPPTVPRPRGPRSCPYPHDPSR
ncbi:hypothetical protein Shyd_00080 [Streptomyces hydrogenans]|uniref:Uncharacterized protein n=1 Tax=Streptomyces hydrogenans TaxID=1873719 RepID=A0ABQ3P0T1_9ACTN|nr:hypothetical protein Shyd_00080 [Streptomyces hydrogenans]